MKHTTKFAGFAILVLAALSCSYARRAVEKKVESGLNTHRVGSMWDDVPKMDGLDDSPTEDLPLSINLVLHGFVNLVLHSDEKSQSATTDWILYKYAGSSTDIDNFYTLDKMKAAGNWSLPEGMTSPCFDGAEKGLYGDACVFQKVENGKQMGIIILALPTKEKDIPTFVYFLRAETEADPTPKKP
ncbi:MAG: hypothetical protein KF756_02190 [Acidobacteria bacterium]|nr:hypothetical protein [Acidobacteriota bacterium]